MLHVVVNICGGSGWNFGFAGNGKSFFNNDDVNGDDGNHSDNQLKFGVGQSYGECGGFEQRFGGGSEEYGVRLWIYRPKFKWKYELWFLYTELKINLIGAQ